MSARPRADSDNRNRRARLRCRIRIGGTAARAPPSGSATGKREGIGGHDMGNQVAAVSLTVYHSGEAKLGGYLLHPLSVPLRSAVRTIPPATARRHTD